MYIYYENKMLNALAGFLPRVPGVEWSETNQCLVYDDTDMKYMKFFIDILDNKLKIYIKNNSGGYIELKPKMIKGVIIKSLPSGMRSKTILTIDNKPVIIVLYGVPGETNNTKIIGLDLVKSKYYKFDWCFMIDEDGYIENLEDYVRENDEE